MTTWTRETTSSTVTSAGVTNYLYATFGVSEDMLRDASANTHYPIPFSNHDSENALDLNFGTGTDPATSWTASNGSSTDASLIVPMIWYIPDNIVIDAVYSIEGGDNPNGDTTRMHLFSYDYSSGSSSVITNGIVIASSADRVNAGTEQTYSGDWSVTAPNVLAGKAVLAFWEQDGTNGDYSVTVTVKYHLS